MIPDASRPLTDSRAGDVRLRGFKAYAIGPSVHPVQPNSRRDFYKICVLTGHSLVHYPHRTLELTGTNLIFANPHLPCAAQVVSAATLTGYACLFSEKFMQASDPTGLLRQTPLFAAGSTPVFTLSPTQGARIASLFQQMLVEQNSAYLFKDELMCSYVSLLLHGAMQMTPAGNLFVLSQDAYPGASLFLNLSQRLGLS